MDPRLAEIYGTNEEVSDTEKTAAAELAEKLAGEDETNMDNMSDEEIEALAQEVLSADEQGEGEQETETETEQDGEKVAADKVAEADFLGRVMAHAYVNELKSIDKEASADSKVLKKVAAMPPQFMKKNGDKDEKKEDKKEEKKEKKSSALDTLAGQRALEILKANGIELEEEKQEEKQASKADVLAQAVEARAIELLKAEGFTFEE